MMHFTIPETIERRDANGTPYTVSKKNVLIKIIGKIEEYLDCIL